MERRVVRSPASRRPIKGQTVFFFLRFNYTSFFIYMYSTFTDVPIIIYERKTALETFRSEIIVRARRDDQTGRGGVNTVDLAAAAAIFPVEGATGTEPPPYAPLLPPPPTREYHYVKEEGGRNRLVNCVREPIILTIVLCADDDLHEPHTHKCLSSKEEIY